MNKEPEIDPWKPDSDETAERLPETFVKQVSERTKAKTSFLDLINLVLVGFSSIFLSLFKKDK